MSLNPQNYEAHKGTAVVVIDPSLPAEFILAYLARKKWVTEVRNLNDFDTNYISQYASCSCTFLLPEVWRKRFMRGVR